MKFLIAALAATAAATPLIPELKADVQLDKRADPIACTIGYQYCGWVLIQDHGWSPDALKYALCDANKDCNFASAQPWDYIWNCTKKFTAAPGVFCKGDCLGPQAHCT
ncbi:hypothetical protein EJ04DRAFT_139664 [Polyplosphaeria fusca]|uniref:Uncharacterized protein n=1 Tax=Polyplosphaeria fusca TaxID=682080 RepID=A0A9P4QM21_9PLEO|nr:hypothetical protein EJ04DRAFT_139664 [Polyplosphaeria fusca]